MRTLGRDLGRGALAMIVFTLLLGLAYPLAITGISQVAFKSEANGLTELIGTSQTLPVLDKNGKQKKDEDGEPVTRPDPRYFQPRPSATGYSATATYFSNRGPNQASARDFYKEQLAAYLDLEGRYSPGLANRDVPVDAVTTSASGVDPHISKANAGIQARRIAAVRKLSPGRVAELIDDNTDGRGLGVLGEPGVNITNINLALDKEGRS